MGEDTKARKILCRKGIAMIYVTGDMHGQKERFRPVKKRHLKKRDTLIVCGDFGFLWTGDPAEKHTLKRIGRHRYPILFVDGCNENHRLLEEYPIVDYAGGKARRISGRLYELLRGEVYTIDGQTVFAFGGGTPTDAYSSAQESPYLLPDEEEMARGIANLEQCGNRVDLIVTHDAPEPLRRMLEIDKLDEISPLHTYLETVSKTVRFSHWCIGKYHLNKRIPPYYHLLFTEIFRLDQTKE